MELGRRAGVVAAGAARGTVAAMAMSGLRQATTALDLVARTPPEAVLRTTAPQLFGRVPVERRPALVELIHWSYGAAGGMLFGLLPRRMRRHAWAGPAYGTLFWAGFQLGIRPLLGLSGGYGRNRQKIALLADHLLYGVTVGASEWPYRD